jgi:predicted transposase YdaD
LRRKARQEGREEGRQEGRQEGTKEILELLKSGRSPEEILREYEPFSKPD